MNQTIQDLQKIQQRMALVAASVALRLAEQAAAREERA